MSKLTVPIEAALLQRFKLLTVAERTTMSEVIRRMVEAYVESKGK